MNRFRKVLCLIILLLAAVFSFPFGTAAGNGKACDHQWQLVRSVLPTCTKAGREEYRCTLCGKKRTDTLPALGHDWSVCMLVNPPTCTQKGLQRCLCSRNREHVKEEELPALGHNWSEWRTETEAAPGRDGSEIRHCERCRLIERRIVAAPAAGWVPAEDRTVTDEWKEHFAPAARELKAADCVPLAFLASKTGGEDTDVCFLALVSGREGDGGPEYMLLVFRKSAEGIAFLKAIPLELSRLLDE